MNKWRISLLVLIIALGLAGCDDYGGYSYVRPDAVNGPAYYGADPAAYGYAVPVGGYYDGYYGGYAGGYYGGAYPVIVGGGGYWHGRPPRGGWHGPGPGGWHGSGRPPGGGWHGGRPGGGWHGGGGGGHGGGGHGGGHRH